MTSFNITNLLFCLLIFIKSVHTTPKQHKPILTFEEDDDYLKYTFEKEVKCLTVQYDGKELVKLDPTKQHPESVYFTINGSTAIVRFNKAVNIFRLDVNHWNPVFSGKKDPKSINVLYKDCCENYVCYTTHRVYYYKAKGNILFNKIRSHPGGNVAEEIIFETKELLDMAYEIVYDETDKNKFLATTYHINGLSRKFFRKSVGKWEEFPREEVSSKLTPEKVEFTIQCQAAKPGFETEKDAKYLRYRFMHEVKCLGVEYDGNELLKVDPNSDRPNTVYFSTTRMVAFFKFKHSMDIFRFDDGKWKSISFEMKEPVELNIGEKSSTDFIKYNRSGKVHTFRSIKGYAFDSIIKQGGCIGYEEIWSSIFSGDYATKAVYDVSNSNYKILEIHGVSGLVTKFAKTSKGWKECVSDSGSRIHEDKVKFTMKLTPKIGLTYSINSLYDDKVET